MQNNIKLSLYTNYFVFAILLNSVGIVILKSQNVYGVDEVMASTLELFKDLSIAIVSFFVASQLPAIGYKKAMLAALLLVTAATLGMYFGNSFLSAKILFAAVGTSFALIKVSVYSVIGQVTNSEKEHNSLMSSIEGVFMFGIALAYFIFPAFNKDDDPNSWLNVYPFLALLCTISFGLLYFSDTSENEASQYTGKGYVEDFIEMIKMVKMKLVIVFVISAFLFVMIEQGIMTWLPTFYDRVMHLPENISIMMASILAISLGLGRLVAGFLTKKISWIVILVSCLIIAALFILLILPQIGKLEVGEIQSFADVPLLGFAFPVIGFFIAPIYPLINSVVLSALPKEKHSAMTGLIVIFSALGGTLGSRLIGWLFKTVGGDLAFYYTLIPIAGLLVSLIALYKLTKVDVQPSVTH
ncbi:MAG TPA: MFS transporter [Saprospiraceae bacterium]|nr:MFS transporter [Saprospiraceae bacterium]HRG42021.1 MFS transporter [Saprospiraceae bacterium]